MREESDLHRMLSLLLTYPDSLLVSARNNHTTTVCVMEEQLINNGL